METGASFRKISIGINSHFDIRKGIADAIPLSYSSDWLELFCFRDFANNF
jgi:hypothetical protein